MSTKKLLRLVGMILLFSIIKPIFTFPQSFSGLNALKKYIEYEGQRFLMDEVYEISVDKVDNLYIKKLIKDFDPDGEFLFLWTSYKLNGLKGAVLTSFSSNYYLYTGQKINPFMNIHLTNEDIVKMDVMMKKLIALDVGYEEHKLQRFNEYIILEYHRSSSGRWCILWINNYNKHKFGVEKWNRTIKAHLSFESD